MSGKVSKPKAPSHLGKDGRRFWRRVHGEYVFEDSAELELVAQAAECLDRVAAAHASIAEHGELCESRDGPRLNPACRLERDAKTQFLAILKRLGIDGAEQAGDRRYRHVRHKEGTGAKTAS